MTTFNFFEDCIHHIFEDGLHMNRTPGVQWKMSSKWSVVLPGLKSGIGYSSNLIWTSKPVIQVNEVNYSKATRHHHTLDWSYNGQPHQVWFSNNFRDTNGQPRSPLKKGHGQQHYKHSPRNLTSYYCEGEHMVKDCIKLAKEKSRDKQKGTDVAKHCKNKI